MLCYGLVFKVKKKKYCNWASFLEKEMWKKRLTKRSFGTIHIRNFDRTHKPQFWTGWCSSALSHSSSLGFGQKYSIHRICGASPKSLPPRSLDLTPCDSFHGVFEKYFIPWVSQNKLKAKDKILASSRINDQNTSKEVYKNMDNCLCIVFREGGGKFAPLKIKILLLFRVLSFTEKPRWLKGLELLLSTFSNVYQHCSTAAVLVFNGAVYQGIISKKVRRGTARNIGLLWTKLAGLSEMN